MYICSLVAGDVVAIVKGQHIGHVGTIVHTHGGTINGVPRIQIRLNAGALVIVSASEVFL